MYVYQNFIQNTLIQNTEMHLRPNITSSSGSCVSCIILVHQSSIVLRQVRQVWYMPIKVIWKNVIVFVISIQSNNNKCYTQLITHYTCVYKSIILNFIKYLAFWILNICIATNIWYEGCIKYK